MKIDGGALYQFRLAFELAQAKGTFKVMPDEVAQHPDINADIVIQNPQSSRLGQTWSGRYSRVR